MFSVFSVNINGLNSPKKRSKCFSYLKQQRADITCIQESHVKQKDSRLLENSRLGKLFVASSLKEKKRGVAIYAKEFLRPKLIQRDEEGRWICVEVYLNGKKTLIVNIYAPNDVKERGKFFKHLENTIMVLEYSSIILLGDFNTIIDLELDKKQSKMKTNENKRC